MNVVIQIMGLISYLGPKAQHKLGLFAIFDKVRSIPFALTVWHLMCLINIGLYFRTRNYHY